MASINEKLNYINETKSLMKDKLNDLGSEIDNETTFREYAEKIKNLYEEWPKISDEDTTINLENTKKGKMNLQLKGNTTQDGTPTPDSPVNVNVVTGNQEIVVCGKNLFDKNSITQGYIDKNGNVVLDEINSTSDFILIPNGTTNLVRTTLKNSAFYDKDKVFISREYLQSLPVPNNAKYIRMQVNNNDLNNEQLEVGSTTTEYESFQSQSYEINLGNIELCKIGDYQDKIAKSTGKNLLSSELETGGISTETGQNSSAGRTRTKDYIDIQPNTEYTLSADYQGWYVVYYYNESQTFISSLANNSNKITFTTPSNAKYLRCVVAIINAQNVMLNTGQTALPYEPYGTSWYLNKQIGKVVLDGSESWAYESSSTTPTNRTVVRLRNEYVSNIYLSNRFVQNSTSSNRLVFMLSNKLPNIFISLDNSLTGINIDDSDDTKIQKTKTYLSENNVLVYFDIIPTYTEITDTTLIQQLENIYNNARSYKDTTIIECSSLIDDNETIQVLAIALKNIN